MKLKKFLSNKYFLKKEKKEIFFYKECVTLLFSILNILQGKFIFDHKKMKSALISPRRCKLDVKIS